MSEENNSTNPENTENEAGEVRETFMGFMSEAMTIREWFQHILVPIDYCMGSIIYIEESLFRYSYKAKGTLGVDSSRSLRAATMQLVQGLSPDTIFNLPTDGFPEEAKLNPHFLTDLSLNRKMLETIVPFIEYLQSKRISVSDSIVLLAILEDLIIKEIKLRMTENDFSVVQKKLDLFREQCKIEVITDHEQ